MITAATRCCGECGKWYYGFNCPHCEKKQKEKKTKEQLKKDGKDA